MDDSVIEVADDTIDVLDSTVEEVDMTKDRTEPVEPVVSRRKQTRGGIKLDDTIDLDSTDESIQNPPPESGSSTDDAQHYTTAVNNTMEATFKSLVTSTPAVNGHANKLDETGDNGHGMDIQDEMCDSYEEKVSVARRSSTEDASDESQGPGQDDKADDEMSGDESISSGNLTLPSKRKRRLDLQNLPKTCSLLTTPSGGRVYLVGTAHFSHESQEDVAAVIQAVQPDVVVLELCQARASTLVLDEKKIMELVQSLTLSSVVEIMQTKGAFHGLMLITMQTMSAHLTRELGMAPGGEFRRAYKEAKAVPGCLLHLGDRPIGITLRRAVGSLSWWQMIKIAFACTSSKVSITKEDVEKYKQKDMLQATIEEMAGEYPNFSRVLVEERDVFLAHSLRMAVDMPRNLTPQDNLGPTEAPVVVGVVGIGHVAGITDKWNSVNREDVAKVLVIPQPTRSQKFVRAAVKTSFVCLSIYGGYRLFRNPINRLSKMVAQWRM